MMAKKDKEQVKEEEIEELEDPAEEQPADPSQAAEIAALQEELSAAEAQAAENLDGWQRAQAEFSNYKKRIARDQEQLFADTRGRVIKRYLEILDDLERALANRPEEGDGLEWAGGIELIYRKFLSLLESEGVVQMDSLGQPFDPSLHEAIAQEESEDYESGTIMEVLQPGYMLGERVLRSAVVRVAS